MVGHLTWTTVVPGSGGQSGGWTFGEFSLHVPPHVELAPSHLHSTCQPLSDADLFLAELDVPDLAPEIETSLREAVRCFRHELYLACLAMLGRASEGAWIEVGCALAPLITKRSGFDHKKVQDRFLNPFVGIGKKILDVLKLYEDAGLPKDVRESSNVRAQDLRNAVIWADAVRESRNSIHYGAVPAMSNCYEKVAALLMGAVPHYKLLYAVKRQAKQSTAKTLGE